VYSVHVFEDDTEQFHFDSYDNTEDSFYQYFGFIFENTDDTTTWRAPVMIGEFSTSVQSSAYWVYMMAYVSTNELSWSYKSINTILDGEEDTEEINEELTYWTDVSSSWLILDLHDLMMVSVEETVTETVDDTVSTIVGILDEVTDPRQTFGLLAAGLTAFNTVWFLNEMSSTFRFNTYWNAAESVAVLTTIVFPAAEVLLWIGSYLNNQTVSFAFVLWSKINQWHLLSLYWVAPALLIVS
jgi:hypothetical protein